MLLYAITGLFSREGRNSADALVLLAQQGNEEALYTLLDSYSPFMKKVAAQVCKRFVDQQDEEYSIALSAFNEAVEKFDPDQNSSFLTFAHMVIRRRIIDFIRKESQRDELIHDFTASAHDEKTRNWVEDQVSMAKFNSDQEAELRKEEIMQFAQTLSEYGISFQVLATVSPRHEDARRTSVQIAQLIAETNEYKEFLLEKKKLPIKEVEQLVQVSRKTIERNRKYIIAVALLLLSDLDHLKDYVKERLL
ncbi:MAG TPA: RNA polymerase sigma-I factor [Planococcus sp. (in: firmicutes)]|nr:RNA polymerase sigma-I factor [Planococcus sp. (in: firmicutes)]